MGSPALCLPLPARGQAHTADGRGQNPALPGRALSARQLARYPEGRCKATRRGGESA